MRDVRFYQEFHNARKTKSTGNCLAVEVKLFRVVSTGKRYERVYDAIATPWDGENVMPCSASVSEGYLRSNCKRVTEDKAREIHPNLFTMLRED